MIKIFRDFAKDDSGATAIEYALLASLIAIGIIVSARSLGTKIGTSMNNAGASLK